MVNSERRVELERIGLMRFRVTNSRGGTMVINSGAGTDPSPEEFTPVELLLAAIAGCTGMDVDAITGKRSEPEHFTVAIRADKIRDARGNRLSNVAVDFSVAFPPDEGGAAATAVLERAVRKSHDVLCTVSRTVEVATPIAVTVGGTPLAESVDGVALSEVD